MAVTTIGAFFDTKKVYNLLTMDYRFTNAWPTVSFVLDNVVINSRYWIYNSDDMSLISSGTAATTTITIPDIAYFGDINTLVRVRKSSGGTKYLPFDTQATITNKGANVFVSQVVDTLAV